MAIATMEVDRKAVFQAVDEQRRRLGLRRRDVTEVLGVARSAYSNWTNGQGLDASRLLRVCAWLDVDPRTFAMEAPEILPDPSSPAGTAGPSTTTTGGACPAATGQDSGPCTPPVRSQGRPRPRGDQMTEQEGAKHDVA